MNAKCYFIWSGVTKHFFWMRKSVLSNTITISFPIYLYPNQYWKEQRHFNICKLLTIFPFYGNNLTIFIQLSRNIFRHLVYIERVPTTTSNLVHMWNVFPFNFELCKWGCVWARISVSFCQYLNATPVSNSSAHLD